MNQRNEILVFIDGGCWPNPGGSASYSIVAFDDLSDRSLKMSLLSFIRANPLFVEIANAVCDNSSNNVAEYFALHRFIENALLHKLCGHKIKIFSDSMMLVNQMSGNWMVRGGSYKSMHDRVVESMNKNGLWDIQFGFLRREDNIAGVLLEEWQKNKGNGEVRYYSDRLFTIYGMK